MLGSVRFVASTLAVLLFASPALARDTVFSSPPVRSPSGGELECAILNASARKPLEGVQIGFRRVNGGTSGATETCGDTVAPLQGCTAKLAGFCEALPCACIFTISKGDKKAVRGTLMSVDSGGTVTGAVELHR
jgi:hypothetical protein